nr:hypothetical protein [Escherichia coli]
GRGLLYYPYLRCCFRFQTLYRWQGNQLTLKNPTAYYLTIAYLGRNEKGVLPGFKTVMVAPFSTVITNTGSYSGSQFYLGYMDDYGALRMTTLNCSGQCRLQAVEAKK